MSSTLQSQAVIKYDYRLDYPLAATEVPPANYIRVTRVRMTMKIASAIGTNNYNIGSRKQLRNGTRKTYA